MGATTDQTETTDYAKPPAGISFNRWQDFTPSEQDCISRCISQKTPEGQEPSDQDVAICISECAPDKARESAAFGTDKAIPITMMGGQYRAAQAEDGTWTVFQVELFAAHVDTRHALPDEQGDVYSEQWLREAIRTAHRRAVEDSYFAPLHVGHHGAGDVRRAGHIVPTHVRKVMLEGRMVPVLFGNLVGIPDRVFQELRQGELPFRSVEVQPHNAEILSVALLEHDVPFFRFPLLTIGETEEHPGSVGRSAGFCRGYRYKGRAMASLFNFNGARNTMQGTEEDTRKFQDDEERDETEEMQDEPEEMQDEGEGGANGLAQLLDQMTVVLSELQDSTGAEAVMKARELLDLAEDLVEEMGAKVEEEPPGEPAGEEVPTGPVEMESDDDMSKDFQAKMLARLDGMEREFKAMKRERRIEKQVAQAEQELRSNRVQVDDHLRGRLKHFAALGSDALNSYVEDRKKFPDPEEPPSHWNGELPGRSGPREPKEVTKYGEKGPEALEDARRLYKVHRAMPPSARRQIPLAKFLATNMKARGASEPFGAEEE